MSLIKSKTVLMHNQYLLLLLHENHVMGLIIITFKYILFRVMYTKRLSQQVYRNSGTYIYYNSETLLVLVFLRVKLCVMG